MTDPAASLDFTAKLFDLARGGRTTELAQYVDQGIPANLSNDNGDTLLMLAAYHDHAELVDALLRRGADPDRANGRGQVPLAGAVFRGNDQVVRALLAAGADPRAGTPSAVDIARLFGRDDLLAEMG